MPAVYWFGVEGGFSILIMELLGNSIDQMHKDGGREFSTMTLALVIDKMIDRIRDMHERHVIHRDLKPENFLVKQLRSCSVLPIYATLGKRENAASSPREKIDEIF